MLDAESILHEFAGNLALCLWKTVRAVRLYAELQPEERGPAFGPEALASRLQLIRRSAAPPEVAEQLECAAQVLSSNPPEASRVVDACCYLATWADEQGALRSALELTQAAAFLHPENARIAHDVARLARRRGEYARAESWYRHAIFASRRAADWEVFARSYLGLGITYTARGSYPAARRALIRSLRRAKRHSIHEVTAMVYHELAVIAIHTHRPAEVARAAKAALDAYGPGHSRLPSLAHDVAVYWMTRGYFQEALLLFRAIPPSYGGPAERLATAGCATRAAGAVGNRQVFEDSWRIAMRLLQSQHAAQSSAAALVDMAKGAMSLGEWDRAESAVHRALEVARERAEAGRIHQAESVLESIRAEQKLAEKLAGEPRHPAPKQVGRLAADFVDAMQTGVGAD